ncbi:hypothetical protein ACQUW5_14985 [Legionella sp. CNM-1927-20]|uniref:hypothetical protein n=1 Tax=Legionella sp. CNM-1927-20 TaxID=3422221 RepID=UPI00403AFCEC
MIEKRYYISSLEPSDSKTIMHAIRQHWQIENNLHRCLDVVYREYQSRIRNEIVHLTLHGFVKQHLLYSKEPLCLKKAYAVNSLIFG